MVGLAAVVILYHPDQDLENRISSYLHQVEKLYLIDNTEPANPLNLQVPKITQIADGKNLGISARLNQAAQLAINDGFSWLLMMDQDSSFEGENLSNYLDCLQNFPEKNAVAQFGPEFLHQPNQPGICAAKITTQLITSGSILNLPAYQQIGPFDEALFIDQVDFEYCYRAVQHGFKNVQFLNVFMNHSLGAVSEYRSLKTAKKTSRSLHSPIRLYYMTRNYLYMRKKYAQAFPAELLQTKKDLLNRIKNNLLYGKSRFAVLKAISAGIFDFSRKKMGKKKP